MAEAPPDQVSAASMSRVDDTTKKLILSAYGNVADEEVTAEEGARLTEQQRWAHLDANLKKQGVHPKAIAAMAKRPSKNKPAPSGGPLCCQTAAVSRLIG